MLPSKNKETGTLCISPRQLAPSQATPILQLYWNTLGWAPYHTINRAVKALRALSYDRVWRVSSKLHSELNSSFLSCWLSNSYFKDLGLLQYRGIQGNCKSGIYFVFWARDFWRRDEIPNRNFSIWAQVTYQQGIAKWEMAIERTHPRLRTVH